MSSKTLIIIPTFNEELKIREVIHGAKKALPNAEILVVDDGSTDRTREIAIREKVKVISHPFNLGYGAALQTGYKYALKEGYENIIQMDGDGQHDPSFLRELLNEIEKEEGDLVIGSRFLPFRSIDSNYSSYHPPFFRKWGMRLFRKITSLIIKQKITDPTSGYQAMNRRILELVSSDKFPYDYPDADVIIMIHKAGFRIREIPVRMFENQSQKSMHKGLKPLYYVFKMFLSIFVTLMRKS